MKKISIILAIAAAALMVSCEKEIDFGGKVGAPIRFGAATGYDNGPATRTEYSGKDENDRLVQSTSQYERIDWVANTDRISILCNEVPGSTKVLDYKITSATASNEKSTADVEPAGEQFNWGTGEHYFFAMYPAPTQDHVTAGEAVLNDNGNHTVTISGKIPATQEVTLSGREYKANMNYAYMYAAKKVDSPESNVELGFKPLVTAFEFTLLADNTFPITSNLTKVQLSASTELAGNFVATIDENGFTGNPTTSNVSKTLTLNLGTGIQLSKTDPVKFTFLALPKGQTGLKLMLTFASGETRSLELKNNSGFISVDACKKVYIRSVGVVPEVLYTLDVTGPEAHDVLPARGSNAERTRTITVTSYRSYDSVSQEPVNWTAEFSKDGKSWSTTPPEGWTFQRGGGSGPSWTCTLRATENTQKKNKEWESSTDYVATSYTNAVDLSQQNIFGVKNENNKRTTANCYVVSAPGWYKIPLVYGNALKLDEPNTQAYINNNSRSNMLKNFVDHNGRPIVGPWINKPSPNGQGYTIDRNAIVCWEDVENDNALFIPKSGDNRPFTEGEYLYFYVSKSKLKQGNALIAVTTNNGATIVWSWHIWVYETEKLDVGKIGTNANNYQMLSVNLGWNEANQTIPMRKIYIRIVQDESRKNGNAYSSQNAGDVFGGNVYYQWGRKDPMRGADGNYEPMHQRGDKPWEVKGVDIGWVTKTVTEPKTHWGMTVNFNGVQEVDYYTRKTKLYHGIQNPNYFYASDHTVTGIPNGIGDYDIGWFEYIAQQSNDGTYNPHSLYNGRWCDEKYYNLWNGSNDVSFNSNTTVVKTIYDPSPVGFKVGHRNVFEPLAGHSYTSLGWGYALETLDHKSMVFPRSGLREQTGELRLKDNAANNEVFIWNAALKSYHGTTGDGDVSGIYLQWSSSPYALADWGPISYGMAIRPIEDN